jgi:hypothetical protein
VAFQEFPGYSSSLWSNTKAVTTEKTPPEITPIRWSAIPEWPSSSWCLWVELTTFLKKILRIIYSIVFNPYY